MKATQAQFKEERLRKEADNLTRKREAGDPDPLHNEFDGSEAFPFYHQRVEQNLEKAEALQPKEASVSKAQLFACYCGLRPQAARR
jgi:hypothetical protein